MERRARRGVVDDAPTTTLPMAKRPNDFLCAVFSCYNDPRAPPSTDALLSLRLTRDGVDGRERRLEDYRRRFGGESRRRVGKIRRAPRSRRRRVRDVDAASAV